MENYRTQHRRFLPVFAAALTAGLMVFTSIAGKPPSLRQNAEPKSTHGRRLYSLGQFIDPKSVDLRTDSPEEQSARGTDGFPVGYKRIHPGNGGSGFLESSKPYKAKTDENHAVKCCSDEGMGPGWSKITESEEWCPFAYTFGEGDYCPVVTFWEASEICASKGGRLCTPMEIMSRCNVGSGCGFDLEFVWTNEKGADDETESTSPDTAPSEMGGRPLVHVFSPYHERDPNPFSPLDFEQWTVLASVRSAQDHYHKYQQLQTAGSSIAFAFDSVVLVCAIVESDAEAIYDVISPYCDHVVILPRSTATQYPEHNLRALPFHQDVINAGTSVMGNNDDFMLMMTNADIVLAPDFYKDVERTMRSENAEALSFNRKTIDLNEAQINTANIADDSIASKHAAATELLQQGLHAVKEGLWERHGGFDCFIFRSSFLKEYNFGDMFGGVPWWSIHTNWALSIMAIGYKNIQSKQFRKGGTFHFGNEMTWRHGASKREIANPPSSHMTFWKDFSRDELEYLLWCPMIRYPPYDANLMQNSINCGKWFRPNRPDSLVPAFVNDGYEQKFWDRYERYLKYRDGFPETIGIQFQGGGFSNIDSYQKRGWIESWG